VRPSWFVFECIHVIEMKNTRIVPMNRARH